ncbi:carbohydrate sulfotransferase 4-like [Palaemon carinicauda]|uniref:carbohydrate sulfotransferase 4-like n=1 Tax=Palaemon carinicauda TaxID=392227 RepID=UPI0035B64B91
MKRVHKTIYSHVRPASTEPVHWIGVKILHQSSNETSRARTFLQDLLHCRLRSSYKNQLAYMSRQLFYKIWNPYLIKNCTPIKSCADPVYVSKMCREANLHVGKIIRLSLKWAWSLLQDDGLDLQIIYLVRDPRATFASRAHVSFCHDVTCKDPKKVCELIEDDLMVASKMQEAFPHRFKLIQYERFNRNAERSLLDLMMFLGFSSLSQKQLDLLYPKTLKPDDPFVTNKNSSTMVDRWRTKTDFANVQAVQEACAKPISMLGLRVFQCHKSTSLQIHNSNVKHEEIIGSAPDSRRLGILEAPVIQRKKPTL